MDAAFDRRSLVTRRILLEVTEFRESRRWFRHLSGVPRTVMEIGRRLLADEDLEIECFYYNSHAGRFYHADRSLFNEPEPNDQSASSGFARLGSATGDFARLLRRGAASARRMRATRGAYRVARRAFARSRGARPVTFRADDTVLILGAMWGSRELPDAIADAELDVGFRVSTLLYDLIPIEYPQFYDEGFPEQYQHYLDRVLAISDHLFVISQATGRDLEAYCSAHGVTQPQTEVIYLGDGAVSATSSVRPAALPDGDFVLAVSTFEPRKNHQVLYDAVKHAQLTGIVIPRIVVVGSPGWLTQELQFVVRNDPETQDAFIWLSRTTDQELAWLYQHTLFTVYPSIAEGWGLPIAESMHFGKFCITCGVSSMPEVAGKLAEYLSPYDPAAWAETIARYASDSAELTEREARIRTEYSPHSWETASAAVREALVD